MRGDRFDALTRVLATSISRRTMLRGGLVGFLAAAGMAGRSSVGGVSAGEATPLASPAATTSLYDIPQPLPPGQPGDLIKTEPLDISPGTRSWRVLYHSTTLDGKDVATSGLLLAPAAPPPAGGFPLLAIAHGVTGVAQHCGPSVSPLTPELPGYPPFFDVLKLFVEFGYVVAAADYQGLGAAGEPSLLVGKTTGQNVLDAARAARKLPELTVAGGTLIWGISQGGQAAASAAGLASTYAPDLSVRGVVELAPAADLTLIATGASHLTTPTATTGLLMLAASSWSRVYGAPLDSVLTQPALDRLHLTDELCLGDLLPIFLEYPPSYYLKANLAETKPWSDLLAQNSAIPPSPGVPVFVGQGEDDTTVPPIATDAYVHKLCAAGATVDYRKYPGADHTTVVLASLADVLPWMAGRRAGTAAASTCG